MCPPGSLSNENAIPNQRGRSPTSNVPKIPGGGLDRKDFADVGGVFSPDVEAAEKVLRECVAVLSEFGLDVEETPTFL